MRSILLHAGDGPAAAARCAALAAQSGSQFPLHHPHAVSMAAAIPGLNTSQRNAIIAGLTRRLTLVQVRHGVLRIHVHHLIICLGVSTDTRGFFFLSGPSGIWKDNYRLRFNKGMASIGTIALPSHCRFKYSG